MSVLFLEVYNCGCLLINKYKKVLLRERKRHTARRVVSTPSVVLTGYPPPLPGYLPPCPDLARGVPYLGTPCQGTPWQGTPHLAGGRGTLHGYPPSRVTPPPAGPGRVPPQVSAPWHSGKCCKALWDMGTPPRCGQTNKVKLLPSRHTTYAGGNKTVSLRDHKRRIARCKASACSPILS